MSFYLPTKIPSYLLRLSHNYGGDASGGTQKAVLDSARVFVAEAVDFENYDGGVYGHGVILFLPMEVLGEISPREQTRLIDKLTADLRTIAANIPGEFISYIRFESNDDRDETFRQSVPVSKRPQINPELLTIWKPDLIRVFLSHRDQYKVQAKELADCLEPFGFSCFVAHDTITPMSEWRLEIMKGLQTMDLLLVFLTDDFQDSIWTNQEVGYALGDEKPVISVKLGLKDPPGFISHLQALKGDIDNPRQTAERLVHLLVAATRSKERIQTALVKAFSAAPDWSEAGKRFNRMQHVVESLSGKETEMIVRSFAENDQLHGAIYLTNNHARLTKFLKRVTGKVFRIEGTQLIEEKDEVDIPF